MIPVQILILRTCSIRRVICRVQLYCCIVLFSDVHFMIGLVFRYHTGFQYTVRTADRRVRGFRKFCLMAGLFLHDCCTCLVLATAVEAFCLILTSSDSAVQEFEVGREFVLKSLMNALRGFPASRSRFPPGNSESAGLLIFDPRTLNSLPSLDSGLARE